MWEKLLEALASRSPLVVIFIGSSLFLIAAVGTIPFVTPALKVSGIVWQISLGAMGAALVLAGLLLLRREPSEISSSQKKRTKTAPLDRSYPEDPRLSLIVPPFEPGRYATVKFPEKPFPTAFNWHYTPLGVTLVYGKPFFVDPVFDSNMQYRGHRTIDIHPHPDNKANVEEVSADVGSVSVVHFLLSAGHGRVEHEGIPFLHKSIGYIELQFAEGDIQREDLILGKNVREWAPGNMGNLVRSLDFSLARPAWVSHNQHYRIDMLSIHVEDGPKDLSSIQVVAKFEDDPPKPMSLPSIIVSSITCERG